MKTKQNKTKPTSEGLDELEIAPLALTNDSEQTAEEKSEGAFHPLLKHQLAQHRGISEPLPSEWESFVRAIDVVYRQFDADRAMLERSLDLSAQELLRANFDMRAVLQAFPDLIFLLNSDGTILDCKGGTTTDLYLPKEKLVGKKIQSIPLAGVSSKFSDSVNLMKEKRSSVTLEYSIDNGGRASCYEARFVPLLEHQIIVNVRNITDYKEAEEELRNTLSLLSATLESTADGILVVDREEKIVRFNRKFVEMWRIPEEIISSRDDNRALEFVLNQLKTPEAFLAKVRELYASPEAESYDLLEFKDGRVYERYSKPQKVDGKSVGRVWSFRDISEQQRLEEQLQQAQKMEAIGQLAGGVAHDFNNLLTVINGHCEFLLDQMGDDLSPRKEVEAIRKTAERAANLTRQLLAFSRSQILQPKILDLNDIVMNMDKMLRRLIGEHIDLLSVKGKDLWPVEADPGQLEQVIMNLAVNARNAMSNGGELLIETCNLTVDDSVKGEVPPGKYVTLTVADTGCGMSPEVQKRIFEPFFTTKEVGRGTGLGLSTVYGIVKQSGGHITVQSVLGKGTAFSLYLPMSERAILEMGTGKIRLEQFKGKEAILLVEDEEEVRAVIIKVLNQQGYTVLAAVNGSEALTVLERHSGRIDLLLTDLVMPIMGGTELAEKLASRRPDIKVLYMSGYTNSDSVRQRILSAGSAFLQKPFTPTELTRSVRETLDAGKKD